jgi:hypothetical protein
MLFGDFNTKNFYLKSFAPKPSLFGAGTGISSLNVQSNNFKTAQPILVIRNSNDAAPRQEFGCKSQDAKICFSTSYR